MRNIIDGIGPMDARGSHNLRDLGERRWRQREPPAINHSLGVVSFTTQSYGQPFFFADFTQSS
jgi:hypothetical protein